MLNEKLLALNESWVELQSGLPAQTRVLLCLESGRFRKELGARAREHQWQVTEANTASEAAEHLERDEVDLLVVAEDPPDMVALSLVRFARGRPSTPKIIVLAHNPSPRKILEAIRLGVTDYLLEPEQRPDELLERMRRRVDHLTKQKIQLRMLSDLRRLYHDTPPEERTILTAALKGRLQAHRERIGPMNRVLVVDPEALVRKHLLSTLAGLGLSASEALGGQSASTLLAEEGTDLVMLSSSLPDLPLDQTLDRIHEIAGEIPVILLASIDEMDKALAALRMGFADSIRKPIASPLQVGHRVVRMLKERRRERLAENLIRELYRLIRKATESVQPQDLGRVDEVFDDIVVLPEQAMDAMPTAPVSAPAAATPGASAPPDAPAPAAPAASAEGPADPAAGGDSGSPRVRAQRLTSDEFQVIAEDGPDVTAADELPDTVVISYIDELLYPALQGKRQGALGAGQRLTPRVERSTFVRYGPTGTEQASLGYAHDLSLGGMFILSGDPPAVGTDLQIELQLPVQNRLERIRVQGRVMWHTDDDRRPPQGDGFGVQFTVVDRTASDAILRVVTHTQR